MGGAAAELKSRPAAKVMSRYSMPTRMRSPSNPAASRDLWSRPENTDMWKCTSFEPVGCPGAWVTATWTGKRPARWSQSRGRRPKRGGRASAGAAPRRRRRRRGNGSGRWGSGSGSRWSASRCCSRCSDCWGRKRRRVSKEVNSKADLWAVKFFIFEGNIWSSSPDKCFLFSPFNTLLTNF